MLGGLLWMVIPSRIPPGGSLPEDLSPGGSFWGDHPEILELLEPPEALQMPEILEIPELLHRF